MIFIFDENFSPRMTRGLSLLEEGNNSSDFGNAEVWHILDLAEHLNFPKSEQTGSYSDKEVIKIAGQKSGIIFTQDSDFKRHKHYFPLYKENNVGVVFYNESKLIRGYWPLLIYTIKKWEDIKEKISVTAVPFCFALTRTGIEQRFP